MTSPAADRNPGAAFPRALGESLTITVTSITSLFICRHQPRWWSGQRFAAIDGAHAAGPSSLRPGRMSALRTIRMICREPWQANTMVMALVRRQAADLEQ